MPALFALTLFVSAALVFSVQPLIAKRLLPAFGGTPAVWNTCLVFFQAALLAGYAYAHRLAAHRPVRRQAVGHQALLALGLACAPLLALPFGLLERLTPSGGANPVPRLLALLTVAVGVPFFVLSATAPLLQKWFSAAAPTTRDPYVLYGASNLGSLLALLGYPALMEPNLSLRTQSWLWVAGYALLVALLAACAVRAGRSADQTPPAPALSARDDVTPGRRLSWLALAFVPASLLYGVTSYVTTDIAAIPLLWVIPLALYLLTFVLVFAPVPLVPQLTVLRAVPVVVLAQTFFFAVQGLQPFWVLVILLCHLATFFVLTLACHGELARLRPPSGRLTEFYLWLSAGGVLGGLFNTLAAPALFDSYLEYPLALVLACFLLPRSGVRPKPLLAWPDLWLPLLLFLLLAVLAPVAGRAVSDPALRLSLVYGLPAAACYTFAYRPVRFGLGVGAILLAGGTGGGERQGQTVYRGRDFFGVLRVVDVAEEAGTFRRFVHGTTLHGMQRRDGGPDQRRQPLTYYFHDGAIGQLFDTFSGPAAKQRFAVLGLGAGTLAAYAEAGQAWTFYEIDPAVAHVADTYFSYLSDARARGADTDVRLGDARLVLAGAPPRSFDMIFADAFSSDAVPVHLLTREALRLYLDRLADGGVVIFNLSNRYLDLEPVVADLAAGEGLCGRIREERAAEVSEDDRRQGKTPSRWVVLARRAEDLGELAESPRWRELRGRAGVRGWTDDYSNLLSVFRWE